MAFYPGEKPLLGSDFGFGFAFDEEAEFEGGEDAGGADEKG